MTRVWMVPVLLVLSGAVVATGPARGGDPVMAAVVLVLFVLFVLFAGMSSPLIFPRPVPAAEARRRGAADGRDETVPTVFVADRPHTDPRPRVGTRTAAAGRVTVPGVERSCN
ncbi:hypothetical protein ACIBRY_05360 [Streptomyces anulatus]